MSSSKKTNTNNEKQEKQKDSSPSKKGKALVSGKPAVKDSSMPKSLPVVEKPRSAEVAKTEDTTDKIAKMMVDLMKNVETSMKKQDAKLNKITSRLDDVDKQFQEFYSYDPCDPNFVDPNFGGVDFNDPSGSCAPGDSVQSVDSDSRNKDTCFSDGEIESEDEHSSSKPKSDNSSKRKSDGQESRFSSLGKKFKMQVITDSSIDDTLAEHVNEFFTKGIDDSRYSELVKDENNARPENCSGLVVVKCNNIIWERLSGTAKTTDRKMQALETTIVKASTLLVKSVNEMSLLEKEDAKYGKEIDRCLEVLALLGHGNRQVNLARRDLLKPELKEEYVPLCNHNLPFTEELFGSDISKTAREIEEVAKIGHKINRRNSVHRSRPYPSPQFRSGYGYPRGRGHFYRGGYAVGYSASRRDGRPFYRPRDPDQSKNYGQRKGSRSKQ